MEYLVGGKPVKEYLEIVKLPLLALIALDVLSFFIGLLMYIPLLGFVFSAINFVTGVLIFLTTLAIAGFVGYSTVKKYKGDLLNASVAGAIAGLLSGAFGGALSVVSAGLGYGLRMGNIYNLGVSFLYLIISPVFGAVIGAIFAFIGGAIAGAKTFGPASGKMEQKTESPGTKT